MRKLALLLAGAVSFGLVSTNRLQADKEAPKAAAFKVYDGYFESNKSGLEGKSSFLVFPDKKAFDQVFRPRPPIGLKKGTFLPANAFETSIVVAVVKRGDRAYAYKVTDATSCKGKVTVNYTAEPLGAGGSATFASPLIVTLPKTGDPRVVFAENGKEVGMVEIGK